MQIITVTGGAPLRGELTVQGAKNAVLPILAATAAQPGQYVLHRCPELQDVQSTLEILEYLGCRTCRHGHTIEVDSRPMCRCEIPQELMGCMRSSILFLGALTAACGQAKLFPPGGCRLGSRPIDLHLSALRAMGAGIETEGSGLLARGARLRGATITLAYPSVGATENIMLAALRAAGTVTVYNAAKEPEIEDLAGFLQAMGARISGAGTAVLQIEGGGSLHDAEYTVMPDCIEAATFLAATAACTGDVTLRGVNVPHLYAVLETLLSAGARIETGHRQLRIRADRLHAPKPICTAPYPGFPTDAQALLMAALLKAEGITIIEEKVFENRLQHAAAFCAMGADIQVANRIARIRGVPKLHGARVEATDLRGAAAIVIAALSAEGDSQIGGICHLLRGYADFDVRLRQLGANLNISELPQTRP